MSEQKSYLGIDYGQVRTGVAKGDSQIKLASPFCVLTEKDTALAVANLAKEQAADAVVVGLPRSLDGDETAWTDEVMAFAADLSARGLTVYMQDEAGTSSLAEDILKDSGKPYTKGDIDMAAASLILQDYLDSL